MTTLFTRIADGQTSSAATFNAPLVQLETAIIALQSQVASLLDVGTSAPVILTHPASQTKSAGQTATFTVSAAGGTLTYQWQKLESGGSTWSDVSGATTTSYTTGALDDTDDNGDSYRCAVTNSIGTTNSNAAVLTVEAAGALADKMAAWWDFTADADDDTGNGWDLTGTAPSYSGAGADFDEDDVLSKTGGGIGTHLSCTIGGWLDVQNLPTSAVELFSSGAFPGFGGGVVISLLSDNHLSAALWGGIEYSDVIYSAAVGFTAAAGVCFFALVHDADAKTITWHTDVGSGLTKGSAQSYSFTPIIGNKVKWGDTTDKFDGILTSCFVANVALDDTDIVTLYNDGTPLAWSEVPSGS